MNTILDIYSDEKLHVEHSLRYIHIVTKNVVGILNRVTSLMRRKRYNIEEVSVSFDVENKAHMILAIDGRLLDVEHVIKQLKKLYDVYSVEDLTNQPNKVVNIFTVKLLHSDELQSLPVQPKRIFKELETVHAVFILSLEETPDFLRFLLINSHSYSRQVFMV